MKVTFKATIVAALALLLVGGGAAGAARLITGKQIKNGSITGADIKNRSLTRKDFRGSVRGPRGFTGAPGPTGTQGPQGPQGPPGPTVVNRIVRAAGPNVTVAAGDNGSSTATCPPGMGIVTGGYVAIAADGEVFVSDTLGSTTSWAALLDNFDSTISGTVQAIAYCAPAGQAVASAASVHRRRAWVSRAVRTRIKAALAANAAAHR